MSIFVCFNFGQILVNFVCSIRTIIFTHICLCASKALRETLENMYCAGSSMFTVTN